MRSDLALKSNHNMILLFDIQFYSARKLVNGNNSSQMFSSRSRQQNLTESILAQFTNLSGKSVSDLSQCQRHKRRRSTEWLHNNYSA